MVKGGVGGDVEGKSPGAAECMNRNEEKKRLTPN